MKKPNTTAIKGSTLATLNYTSEVKLVKKARPANDVLSAAITAKGGTVAEPGSACPFKTVLKHSSWTAQLGGSLRYKKMAESTMARNNNPGEYHPEHRNLGMFPVYGEMLWVSNDLTKMYVRVYQTGIPSESWYEADGKKVPKEILAQWLPSDDFKRLSGEYVAPPLIADLDGDIIFAQDEDGNIVKDSNGEPVAMALPPVRSLKAENCEFTQKKGTVKLNFFSEEDFTEAELVTLREAFYAKFEEHA
jgi:hypothetical protein